MAIPPVVSSGMTDLSRDGHAVSGVEAWYASTLKHTPLSRLD